MRAATEGHLPPVMPEGNLVEVLSREVRKGSPGELMVEISPSRQRRPPCKTSKVMSDEAADAVALTYLLTAMRPPRPGGWAVLQFGWGTLWCTGPVGRVVGTRARGRFHRAPLVGGGVGGAVPPPLALAFGRPRAPLAVCPWRAVPQAAGQPPTQGGRWRMSWTLRLLPSRGPCEALPVARARPALEWWGCEPVWCATSWMSVGDRW